VKRLEEAASSHRETATDSKEARKVKILGWLWMDMAAQEFGWELLAWDWETGASIMVFSPDRAWCVNGEHMFAFGPSQTHDLKALHSLRDSAIWLPLRRGRIMKDVAS
jgi:hypothetical protein